MAPLTLAYTSGYCSLAQSSPGPDVNWLVLRSNPSCILSWFSGLPVDVSELAQPGQLLGRTYKCASGCCNLAWLGLLLALVLMLICKDCILKKEFTKLLYQISFQG